MRASNAVVSVDCDGTLVRTDLLHESVYGLLKTAPYLLFLIPFWLMKGKAYLKVKLASHVDLNVGLLPYNRELIEYLRGRAEQGHQIVLATASPRLYAEAVAEHLGIFDRVEATSEEVNLAGKAKARRLIELFGERGFDYAGNGRHDVHVWKYARSAITVNAKPRTVKHAQALSPVIASFESPRRHLRDWLSAIRLHQWLKNLLLVVPLVTSHSFFYFDSVMLSILGFLAFSFCASSVYVLNDLLDLEVDRQHPRKRNRAFASGAISVLVGTVLIPSLLLLSILCALFLPASFGVVLATYFVLTLIYSLSFKRRPIFDVLTLAVLYTIRIIAGAVAIGVSLSFWLLAFSMFLFLSLAMVKRYSETSLLTDSHKVQLAGRGYTNDDRMLLMNVGVASGFAAVLVMALYVNSPDVNDLYSSPQILWLILPPLLFWITRVWMIANRGEMHDDPVVFAVTDRASLVIAFLVALVMAVSAVVPGLEI